MHSSETGCDCPVRAACAIGRQMDALPVDPRLHEHGLDIIGVLFTDSIEFSRHLGISPRQWLEMAHRCVAIALEHGEDGEVEVVKGH